MKRETVISKEHSEIEVFKNEYDGITYIDIRKVKNNQLTKNHITVSIDIAYILQKELTRFIRGNKLKTDEVPLSDRLKLSIKKIPSCIFEKVENPQLYVLRLEVFKYQNNHYQPKKYNRFTLNKFESAILLSRLKKVIRSKDKKKLFHKPFKGFIDQPYSHKYFEDRFWKGM